MSDVQCDQVKNETAVPNPKASNKDIKALYKVCLK